MTENTITIMNQNKKVNIPEIVYVLFVIYLFVYPKLYI